MTNSMSIADLKRLALNALSQRENGRDFMLDDVYGYTRAAYERYPEDRVISQMAFAIEKMASRSSSGATINQASISKMYNDFVRLAGKSNFRNELGFLLLDEAPQHNSVNPDYSRLNRVDAEDSGLSSDDFVDRNVVDAMTSIFDKDIGPIKAFNSKVAEHGIKFIKSALQSLGFKDIPVNIVDGNQHGIIYAAHFDTPTGQATISIPTEINNGQVLLPSTFMVDNSVKELTSANLNEFISTAAPIPEDSMFGRGNPSSVIPNADREIRSDLESQPTAQMPSELEHLAKDFEDSVLESASVFGLQAIRKGKEIIAKELMASGFKNAQVKFGAESGNSVVYLASINTPKGPVEIEVPLEMQAVANRHIPLSPSYFVYDGLVEDFTSTKLQRFAVNIPAPSSQNITYSSAYAYMTLPELKDEILKSASEDDYVTCESILNSIQDRFSESDFKNCVADYHFILTHKANMNKKAQHKCARAIPAGQGSIYERCGCFGVPIHKVITDENGNCRLRSSVDRDVLNPVEEGGASISISKIRWT